MHPRLFQPRNRSMPLTVGAALSTPAVKFIQFDQGAYIPRERIWAHYEIPLHDLLREPCRPIQSADDPASDTSDPPF